MLKPQPIDSIQVIKELQNQIRLNGNQLKFHKNANNREMIWYYKGKIDGLKNAIQFLCLLRKYKASQTE